MKIIEIKPGIFYTGVQDENLRVFDIIMETEFGTSYNSYVIKGSYKTALVDTAKSCFFEEYLNKISTVCDVEEIDYLIVSHTEPDHSGSIEKLLKINNRIKVVGTQSALMFLKEMVDVDFESTAVRDGDKLSLGDKTLEFLSLPNLHWPDTMFTYVPESRVLFTCDCFGAHYSFPKVLRSDLEDVEDYLKSAKYYFDMILGPFKTPFIKNALERIKTLNYDIIATGHGPVLDSNIDEILNLYSVWSSVHKREKKNVAILYVSAYGYTEMLAREIERGVLDSGEIEVEVYNLVDSSDYEEAVGRLSDADGILFGTPTILGDALEPIWSAVNSMFPPIHGGKLAAAFGSYGWSGEGVPNITERLKQLRLKVLEGFRIRFKPNPEQLKLAYDFGMNFGKAVLEK